LRYSIKIRYALLSFCLLIYALKYSYITEILSLVISFSGLVFSDFKYAVNQLDFNIADHFISVILILVLPVIIIRGWKRSGAKRLSFNSFVILMLILLFVFAPLISNADPEAGRDLRVTKLLPPFSSLKALQLESKKDGHDFYSKKNKIIPGTLNNIIFADSISFKNKIFVYQRGKVTVLDKKEVSFEAGIPRVETALFILGTDEFGRDIFSRLVYGTRISLIVGCGAVLVTFILGVGLGFTAGYSGGIIDTVLSRLSDMLLAFPVIFLVILLIALFGNSLVTVILVLGYSGWMSLFKVVRSEVISVKGKDFFISAKLGGLKGKDLLIKEVLPVIITPVIVNLIFQYGNVILAEAALSFLGLGTGNSYPSWGAMIDSGQQYLEQAWWMIFFPGLALIITLFTANNLGREINSYFNPGLEK
jgi:peptide/nickel transport system permease protein